MSAPHLRLVSASSMQEKRREAQTTYGDAWVETLLIQLGEQVQAQKAQITRLRKRCRRLTRKVSDLEGGITP